MYDIELFFHDIMFFGRDIGYNIGHDASTTFSRCHIAAAPGGAAA
jgi:hypothetical protein